MEFRRLKRLGRVAALLASRQALPIDIQAFGVREERLSPLTIPIIRGC